jgi:hypothetical protein
MYQQKPKNNINNPRILAPANWKPLARWLPLDQHEKFAWMWRQGEYEYYRHTGTGNYLVLDQFGQSYCESDLGVIPADFPTQYKHVTGTPYQMPPAADPVEPKTPASPSNVIRDTDDDIDDLNDEEDEDENEEDLDDSPLEMVKDVARSRIGRLWRREDQITLERGMQIFSALLLYELGISFKRAVEWLG